MKVEIHNFQAIAKARLDIAGFTALVGRSNIGKSAVIRALKCALTGAEGTDFVRHDPTTCARILKQNKKCKCFSSVKLTLENGDSILWEKGDAVNQYTTWEGGQKQTYTRLGKNPEMPPLLKGFEPIQVGSNPKELVQVSDQFNPVFLLNVSGTAVADLLSDVAQLDEINRAMRNVTKDRKRDSSTRDVRERDIAQIGQDLHIYTTLDNTIQKLEDVEGLHANLKGKKHQLTQVDGFITRTTGSKQVIQGLKDALKPSLPTLDKLSQTDAKLGRTASYLSQLQEKGPIVKRLKGVSDLQLPEAAPVTKAIAHLETVSKYVRKLQNIKVILTKYKGVSSLALAEKPGVEEKFQALKSLEGYTSRHQDVTQSIADLEEECEQAIAEERKALEEFEALGVCPTCSQVVSPEHVTCKAG